MIDMQAADRLRTEEDHSALRTPHSALLLVDEATRPYLGQWNRLVSTTNWEKGRIIAAWREALIAAGAPPAESSDEAWSRRVGHVSGQHVGRLRRVYERFGAVQQGYSGLFWSHFQAALDWNDAEMWLEGAVQSDWSIAEMRRQRWQALGALDELKPRSEDVIVAELDEDSAPDDDGRSATLPMSNSVGVVRNPSGRTDGEVEDAFSQAADDDREPEAAQDGPDDTWDSPAAETIRPFARLAELPEDLGEAFESYKLAILRHKLAGWLEISQDDVLASLDALKQLALAPSE